MNLAHNTILITGGGSGIGLALAKRFVAAGSTVIVCGRRADALAAAKRECPALHTLEADVSSAAERTRLHERVLREFPKLNVLVNNAGIQQRNPPIGQPQDWTKYEQELAINLAAPIHLSLLFAPHLTGQPNAAVLNVSSGLAFLPVAFMPTYCATKAALHSFTLSLRHQLQATSVQVIEVIPPAVNTDLGGKGLHDFGVPLDKYADDVMVHLAKGELEFGFEMSERARHASRAELDDMFAKMNSR